MTTMLNIISTFSVVLVFFSVGFVQGEECSKVQSFSNLCLKDQGSTIVIENEKLSMTVTKEKATITDLRYNSKLEPNKHTINLLKSGSGYYLANIGVSGTSKESGVGKATMKIVQNTANIIDIAFEHKDYAAWPTEFEMHLVLEKGSSMFYYYSVHRYTSAMASGYTIGQLRWALRTNKDVFKYYNVDGKRAGTFPTDKQWSGYKELQDTTYKLSDGTVYTKYQQVSSNEDISTVFGVFDDHLGLSLIQANKEWISGGPFKQDLTTHSSDPPPDARGPLVLFQEHSGHYGTPGITPKKGWTKVYGPVAFYLNEGDSPSAMYKDAQSKLNEEVRKWPYSWVTATEYNAAGRGTVSGTLQVDGVKPEWAYIILTDPAVTDPQLESGTYMYMAKTGSDGKFSIGARPGTYNLIVIAKGVVGKYTKSGIKVDSKQHLDLSTVNWKPDSHGALLWQIGVPDHSAAEFHAPAGSPSPVPNLDGYRKFGTWLSYSKEFPNDVDFTVGKSDAAKDWCYFMPMIKTPGSDAMLKDAGVTLHDVATNWKVKFDYKGTGKGNATLTMGFAAAVKGGIKATMNGQQIYKIDTFEGVSGDSSYYRQVAHGIFRQYTATFNESILKSGENVLEFMPPGSVSRNSQDHIVMFDFVRLEVQG